MRSSACGLLSSSCLPLQLTTLGKGQFGQVLLARDHTGRLVALKALRRSQVRSPADRSLYCGLGSSAVLFIGLRH